MKWRSTSLWPGEGEMVIKKAALVAVAVKKNQYPEDNLPEIAFAGRSNVGKSSLFNLLVNRKNLAKVSGSPGKTRTINFYEVNESFRIVDIPGYGYAKVSKSISGSWGEMLEDYLQGRAGLVKVVQLVDIRHPPSVLDVRMYDYLRHHGLSGIVVATKADKVSRSEVPKCISVIRKTLNMDAEDKVIPISALKRTGYEELLKELDGLLNGSVKE